MGYCTFFREVEETRRDAGVKKDSKWQRMFSSHPDLDKRIKTMSKRAEKDGFTRPENKMPEKIVCKEPTTTKQKSNTQTTTRKRSGNHTVGKKPVGKHPVGKRPAHRKR